MLRLLFDEDFSGVVVKILRQRVPAMDAHRVQELDLRGTLDDALLVWAAARERVLVSHDVSTMPAALYKRLDAGQAVPGLILVPQQVPPPRAAAELDELVQVLDASYFSDDPIIYVRAR